MKLLFTLFFALYTLVSIAQDSAKLNPDLVSLAQPAKSQTQIELESVKRERDFYEKMYAQAKESAGAAHSDLTSSLWALAGIVLGSVAILVGGQIFSNYKLNEQLLAGFRQDINTRIEEIDTIFQTRFNELSSTVAANALNNQKDRKKIFKRFDYTQHLISMHLIDQKGDYELAVRLFMSFFNSMDDFNDIGPSVKAEFSTMVYELPEIKQDDYNDLIIILNKLLEVYPNDAVLLYLQRGLESKPVYILTDNIDGNKVYVKNRPLT